jgi:hypothetical protein
MTRFWGAPFVLGPLTPIVEATMNASAMLLATSTFAAPSFPFHADAVLPASAQANVSI